MKLNESKAFQFMEATMSFIYFILGERSSATSYGRMKRLGSLPFTWFRRPKRQAIPRGLNCDCRDHSLTCDCMFWVLGGVAGATKRHSMSRLHQLVSGVLMKKDCTPCITLATPVNLPHAHTLAWLHAFN